MTFDNFSSAQMVFLWGTFAIALVMGAVANKTNFCTMGAVSDWVNMGDTGRMRAWLLAIAVALLGVAILENLGQARPDAAFPPYRGGQLNWLENLLGGLLFGIGMTIASGCGNKTLVRIGGGNLKSLMVLLVISVIAYFMTNPFPGSDKTLYSELFFPWTSALTVALAGKQDVSSLVAGEGALADARLWIGVVVALLIMGVVFKSREFRGSFDNILGGLVIGLAVVGGWYVSSNAAVTAEGEQFSLQSFVSEQWEFYAAETDVKPDDIRPLAPQSFTFINPMGQTLGYAAEGFNKSALTFGIMSLFGVVAGSFLWSLLSRSFRIEWFASFKDFGNHFLGAILMGFGGVLAMGCTIGQAITGVSTLALGSIITFASIVLGSALTMKIQYYKMVYEGEATFMKALLSSLVDFKLLPSALRKLDAI